MTKTFKVGDKVRRIVPSYEEVTLGGEYEVRDAEGVNLWLVGLRLSYSTDYFELVENKPSLEDVLREQYPIVYDDLVSMGKFGLEPREDVFEVTIRTPKNGRETEETIEDYLKDYVEKVPNTYLVSVKKVSD